MYELIRCLYSLLFADVDLRSESRLERRSNGSNQQQQQPQQNLYQQQYHNTLSRRNSTGSSALNGGMNSHTAAINLQSSGQTAVVGHHRGFSSTVVAAANSAASGDCPWFMPHQMPPTAPARQHKRPAPQPGGGVPGGGGMGHVGMQPPQFINPPPAPQQQSQPPPQHSPQQHQQMAPPQLPPHSVTVSCLNIPYAVQLTRTIASYVFRVIKISIPSTCRRLSNNSSSNITSNHHQCTPEEWSLRCTTYQNLPISTVCLGRPVSSKQHSITSQRPSTVLWAAISRISCPPR